MLFRSVSQSRYSIGLAVGGSLAVGWCVGSGTGLAGSQRIGVGAGIAGGGGIGPST